MQTQHTFLHIGTVATCIFDVALHADYTCNAITSPHVDTRHKNSPEGNHTPDTAHQLFPCQTRANEVSEFDKRKSGVLEQRIPARLLAGRECLRTCIACVSDTRRVLRNAYLVLGYLVTPLERCRLQHVHL